jgi:hypothetical protein
MYSKHIEQTVQPDQLIVFGGRVDSDEGGQGGGVSDELITISAGELCACACWHGLDD